jgi:hypothetical protein
MNPAHKIHERVIGDMSKEQELHHQQMLEPLRVAIYPTNIAGRIAFSSQAGTVLVGVRPDLRSDECWVCWPLFRPDRTVLPYADCPMADTLGKKRPIRGRVAERPSGACLHLMGFSRLFFDGTGRCSGGHHASN